MGESAPPPSTLRRRNSISNPVIVPKNLILPFSASLPNGTASSQPHLDLDFLSLKSPYTSLKDLIPSAAAVNSPTTPAPAGSFGCEISIRNHLVKQAAWAYLQPMSASPDSSAPRFFRRIWLRFSSCLQFLHIRLFSGLSRLFNRIIGGGILATR